MNHISYKRRKIIIGHESPSMIPVFGNRNNKSKEDLREVDNLSRKSGNLSSGGNRKRAAAFDEDNGNDVSDGKRRLRILLEAANQVTDDEGDSDDDHLKDKPKGKKKDVAVPVVDASNHQKPRETVQASLNIHRHEYRFPAYLPMGRPLPAPPRLPSIPSGYKFTTAIIGQ